MPDLTNRFLEGNGYGYVEAGLPNITGEIKETGNMWNSTTGCFELNTKAANHTHYTSTSSTPRGFNMDASRSSSIYGNSETVQPATCKCNFCIKF